MTSTKNLIILDANSLLHRAWHALPPFTNAEGKLVNAVYGMLLILLKLLQEQKPDAVIACWDTFEPTFRHRAFAKYKAQREKQPDAFYEQIPWTKEAIRLFGVESLSSAGFEADDVIGTLALQNKKSGWNVTLVSSDRDFLQLVQPHISLMLLKKGVTDVMMFDAEKVQEVYGLTPEQFVDYKAMCGDPSDNIPGIPGIGEKGAAALLQTYRSLAMIIEAAHDSRADFTAGLRKKILDAEKQLPDVLKLVRIVTDAPVSWQPISIDKSRAVDEEIRAFLLRMNFQSLLKRFPPSHEEKPHVAVKSASRKLKTVENLSDFDEMAKVIRASKEVAVVLSRGAEHSLFAEAIDGLVLATREQTFVIPPSLFQKTRARSQLTKLFSDESLRFLTHDAKAESHRLKKIGLPSCSWVFDTMLAGYVLDAHEHSFELLFLVQKHLSFSLSDTVNAPDRADAILRLAHVLRERLSSEGLLPILERFEMPLVPVLCTMERHGVKVDRPYLSRLSQEMTADKQTLEKKMVRLVGKEFNPASPLQLAEILFTHLQLSTKGIKRGKTGYSTAAPELEKLRGKHPLIEFVEEHRELSKLLSTYVDVLPSLADRESRVHTTFNQAVTATGRLSSSDPNLQNIPARSELGRRIRRVFIAEKGFCLLSCDYSQIELRLVAALAKDERMLEAFQKGEDIHSATAAAIWNIPLDQVSKDQRRAAKAINFGIIYGQGANGLSASAGVSYAEAKHFIESYFVAYAGVKQYLEETKEIARKLGYVQTLFGRRRSIPEITFMVPQLRAQAERMAINMPVQGTAADLMKLAMIRVHQKLPDVSSGARLLLQVHDELVLEVPKKEVEYIAAFVREIMENIEKVGVLLAADARAGENWDEMRSVC